MAFDFPSSPAIGQQFASGSGPIYTWNGHAWDLNAAAIKPADAFVATLSADQTGVAANTWTKINFNTAGYNQNGKFSTSNSRWTPSAGPVQIEAQLTTNNSTSIYTAIYKNGTLFRQMGAGPSAIQSRITVTDNANGTDYYEVWIILSLAGSVVSAAYDTFFQGFAIVPKGPAGAPGPQGPQGTPGPTTPADAFVATLSADQTGFPATTYTKVNFNTAGYNQNSKFNTSNGRWAPSAGPVQIEAQLSFSAAGGLNVAIYKNGTLFKVDSISNAFFVAISIVDNANGTDYYECWGYSSVANTVSSNTGFTFFQGFAIAPAGPQGPSGSGTGNVLSSGTPVNGQIAQWTNATTIQGVNAPWLPLSGGTMTGALNVVTPAPGDNSNQAASTAFVDALVLPGAWTAYGVSVGATSGALNNASASGRYKQIGKTVFVQISITILNIGTASGFLTATLPVACSGSASFMLAGRENSVVGFTAVGLISSGTGSVTIYRYDNTTTIGTNYWLVVSGVYEAA
jgi:hypothetical protein